ncbi:ribosome maturation factor RimP [Alcanivorax quisquiliarum]|uniref:Ribosome maturation factor RimP n=1 Tax=Alcanivorax quisquiliarum TaxID=2933565 RepID=A0ABT0E880_9GAMM|nr:ribosome maturation factor RimP [Alcanivorax quisquiliarum]MCK0538044.1 ribosome maturation factor RimP [Alcanivorax quisquiliarum]
MRKADQLEALLAPTVESMGFMFWGLEYIQGRGAVLRVFIDHEEGITVDDCADVSHQISGVLDVEDPITGEYTLEVSSPGMDRPLFTLEQWQLYIGEQAQVRLLAPVENRRRMTAEITAVDGDNLHLTVDGQTLVVPFAQVDRANVVPQFD